MSVESGVSGHIWTMSTDKLLFFHDGFLYALNTLVPKNISLHLGDFKLVQII